MTFEKLHLALFMLFSESAPNQYNFQHFKFCFTTMIGIKLDKFRVRFVISLIFNHFYTNMTIYNDFKDIMYLYGGLSRTKMPLSVVVIPPIE